mmetsp:Transcript_21708/g.33441  ORF Transcript_21708/g.33441 Transcript_21708/m.33441 type:complete len:92 (+) Transcript_21708:503-778(+)
MHESSNRKAPLDKTLLNQSSAQDVSEEFGQPDSAVKLQNTIQHAKASRWKTPLEVKKKLTVPNSKASRDNDLSPVMHPDYAGKRMKTHLPQ